MAARHERFEQAMSLVLYDEVTNSLVSLWGRRTIAYYMRAGMCKQSRGHDATSGMRSTVDPHPHDDTV